MFSHKRIQPQYSAVNVRKQFATWRCSHDHVLWICLDAETPSGIIYSAPFCFKEILPLWGYERLETAPIELDTYIPTNNHLILKVSSFLSFVWKMTKLYHFIRIAHGNSYICQFIMRYEQRFFLYAWSIQTVINLHKIWFFFFLSIRFS